VVAHVLAVVGPVRLSFRAIEDLPEVRTKPVEQRVEGRVVNWPPAGGPQLRHALSNRELRHAAHREPPKNESAAQTARLASSGAGAMALRNSCAARISTGTLGQNSHATGVRSARTVQSARTILTAWVSSKMPIVGESEWLAKKSANAPRWRP